MSGRKKVLELFEVQEDFWQEKVLDGIERYRKGDAQLNVTDKNGNPVQNAKVKITQKSHEFRFGANIFMLDELETDEKNASYKKHFSEVFNMATLPFYWDTLEPEKGKPRYEKNSPRIYRRPAIDLCIEFCEKHGIEPREHALAYDAFFPKWLYGASVAEVKRELERRYSEIAERYADKIRTIEVTNETGWPSGKTAFYDEPDFIDWCFKLAEKYFPNNQLVINDGGMWVDKGRVTDRYYAHTEAALLKGARIDAIGLQYHAATLPKETEYDEMQVMFNPNKLYRIMDLYALLGKPLQISEITIPSYSWESEDEEVQAEILDRLYSIWFSHPNVEQIIYWNLVDGYAHLWDPSPEAIKASQGDMTRGENRFYGGLLRFDLSPKPAYFKLKELIQERWHTEADLVTNESGSTAFRGFYGEYDVEIETDHGIVRKIISLSKKQ